MYDLCLIRHEMGGAAIFATPFVTCFFRHATSVLANISLRFVVVIYLQTVIDIGIAMFT